MLSASGRLSLLIYILLLHPSNAENREADKVFFEKTNISFVYLPSNPLTNNSDFLNVPTSQPFRRYPMETTSFRFTFNAARCFSKDNAATEDHIVIMSFLQDWNPENPPKMSDITRDAFVLTRNREEEIAERKQNDIVAVWVRKYPYILTRYNQGHLLYPNNSNYYINMYNGDFYVTVQKEFISISSYRQGSVDVEYKHSIRRPAGARYMALFSRLHEKCPSFISAVDKKFPIWLPGRSITVNGTRVAEKKATTVLRDVFVATIISGVYFLLLIHYILPLYFRIVSTLAAMTEKNPGSDANGDLLALENNSESSIVHHRIPAKGEPSEVEGGRRRRRLLSANSTD